MLTTRVKWLFLCVVCFSPCVDSELRSQEPPPDSSPGNIPPPPGSAGPSGFAFGPPGFGALGMGGMQNSLLSLIQLPEVGREIKLSEDQASDIQDLQKGLSDSIQQQLASLNPQDMFNLDEYERLEKMADFREAIESLHKTHDQKLKEKISSAQWTRLIGLLIQRQGVQALNVHEVRHEMQLTDQQLQLIKTSEYSPFPPPGVGGGFPDFAAMERTRQENEKKLMDSFSAEQNNTWKQLQGEPFKFTTQPQPGRGMMGPPGGRPKELVAKYDKNDDGWLNRVERDAAREEAKQGGGGFGPPGGGPPGFGPPGFGPPGGGPPGFGPPRGGPPGFDLREVRVLVQVDLDLREELGLVLLVAVPQDLDHGNRESLE